MSNSNKEYKIVSKSVAPIYSKPSFSSELINQALFWEELIVENSSDNWLKIKQKDGYVGWVHSFYITDSKTYDNNKFLKNIDNWYFVKSRFLEIITHQQDSLFLSFGSIIPCIAKNNKFYIILPNGDEHYIDKNLLININQNISIDDLINISKVLLNVPYLWGGRSSYGIDCSGLIQLLLGFMKIYLPRDTKDQIKYENMALVTDNYIKGDLIFFSKNNIINHIGMLINENEYIHSSGCVKIDTLKSDTNLNSMIDSVYRIEI